MTLGQILLVASFAVGMGLGQLLLKFAALRHPPVDANAASRLVGLVTDWAFLLGAVVYATLLVYWVWLLSFLPLSRAYPFTVLSLAVAAVGSALFFHEPVSPRLAAGIAVIGVGLFLIGTEPGQ